MSRQAQTIHEFAIARNRAAAGDREAASRYADLAHRAETLDVRAELLDRASESLRSAHANEQAINDRLHGRRSP